MADVFDTITHLINSPPGQVVAGGVLAGIVWKFFERVEALLTDQTKLEIAVWLVGRKKLSPAFQKWPDTFAKIFDRVFGKRHLSWKCFGRSSIASVAIGLLALPLTLRIPFDSDFFATLFRNTMPLLLISSFYIIVFGILPDYLSLLGTRSILRVMQRSHAYLWLPLMGLDIIVTMATVIASPTTFVTIGDSVLFGPNPRSRAPHSLLMMWGWEVLEIFVRPAYRWGRPLPMGWTLLPSAMLTSVWLWLYAGSGFLLRAARRFDIGFDWFNRKFDIEKHPLQSIGLVAGALVALVYWAAVVVGHFV